VLLAGNRAQGIDDVERAETVLNDGVGYDSANPEGRWVSAAESLPTLRVLPDWVPSTPMAVRGRKRVLADLGRMEQSLERAAREGIEWHLALDM